MPRTPDPFKARFKWVMAQMEKQGLEIGGVEINEKNGTFRVLTVAGAGSKLSAYEKWKQDQETSS